MQELKPCPFCGGKVRRVTGLIGINFFKCQKCRVIIRFDNDYYNDHQDEAIEAYNRRVNDENCGGN